jgi:hypothetical protein
VRLRIAKPPLIANRPPSKISANVESAGTPPTIASAAHWHVAFVVLFLVQVPVLVPGSTLFGEVSGPQPGTF